MTTHQDFEEHIRIQGISKTEAARRCDVHRNAVHAWCKGTVPPPRQARTIADKLGFQSVNWPRSGESTTLTVDFGKHAWKVDRIVAHARKRDLNVDELVHETVENNIEAFEGSPTGACSVLSPRDGNYRVGPRGSGEYVLVVKMGAGECDDLAELATLAGRMSPSEWVRRIVQEELAAPEKELMRRAEARGRRYQYGMDAVEPFVEPQPATSATSGAAMFVDEPTQEVDYE